MTKRLLPALFLLALVGTARAQSYFGQFTIQKYGEPSGVFLGVTLVTTLNYSQFAQCESDEAGMIHGFTGNQGNGQRWASTAVDGTDTSPTCEPSGNYANIIYSTDGSVGTANLISMHGMDNGTDCWNYLTQKLIPAINAAWLNGLVDPYNYVFGSCRD